MIRPCEALELETGKSPVGNALNPDCRCGDLVAVRSAADWHAGGILGGDCHTRGDAINFGFDAHNVRPSTSLPAQWAHRSEQLNRPTLAQT
jgi:hypothetical protein